MDRTLNLPRARNEPLKARWGIVWLAAIGALILLLLAGCTTVMSNDVPQCERLIPASLLEETPGADLPEARTLPDGHDDAQPWQVGFVAQTGQLEIANTRAPAVDFIYKECLKLHREQLEKDTGGFFSRLF